SRRGRGRPIRGRQSKFYTRLAEAQPPRRHAAQYVIAGAVDEGASPSAAFGGFASSVRPVTTSATEGGRRARARSRTLAAATRASRMPYATDPNRPICLSGVFAFRRTSGNAPEPPSPDDPSALLL